MNDNGKTCIAIRHILFEDLGHFEDPIRKAGYDIQYREAPVDNFEDAPDADLLVILGGPCSVNEGGLYPYIDQEIAIAKHRIDNALPTLGICLGAQIIAHAAGANVYAGDHGVEIGWAPISFTKEGAQSFLSPLGENGAPIFHWHGDTFDLPKNATLIASSEQYKHQIFSISNNILAFQSHPELDPAKIEYWLIGHACELSQNGVDRSQIRKDTVNYSAAFKQNSDQSIANWLKIISP